MRRAKATTPLYVRLDAGLHAAMTEAVRGSPEAWKTLTDFVSVAVRNELDRVVQRQRRAAAAADAASVVAAAADATKANNTK